MNTQITKYKGSKICFSDEGTGKCLVLVHGFTESLDIWTDFSSVLKEEFRVVCIDLPGHGNSDCIDEIHSMELMAEVIKYVLDQLNITKCAMLGHSMGGYVSLAFADKYPDMLNGLCLFHSTAFADPPEARYNREKTIEYVRHHHTAFLSAFIPDLFAPASREKFAEAIEKLVESTRNMTSESIIAAQRGMMERPDRSHVLASSTYPVLFMLGKLDSRIPYDQALLQVALPQDAVLLSMGEVGHMGYIEARDKTLYALRVFMEGL